MNRSELVLRLILCEISDDYENIDQIILPHVAERGAKCGLVIERSEIVEVLARLIEEGMAPAYILSAWEPFATELQGMPTVDVVESDFKTYFYVTKKGKDFLLANFSWWPFDDEEDMRPDWHLDRDES